MHARVVSFTGAKDIDAGITFLRDKVIPMLAQQKGYRGVTASADREGGLFAVLSMWDTAADRDATDASMAQNRQEAQKLIGGEMKAESFESLVEEMGQTPPAPGARLIVTRVSMDPDKIDENISYFKSEVVPQIKSSEGFLGLRNMINRSTGDGIVGTAWSDQAALEKAAQAAQARRDEAMTRGVRFGDMSIREVVLVDAK
jgi:heme-degrading monooxygenase HmoA